MRKPKTTPRADIVQPPPGLWKPFADATTPPRKVPIAMRLDIDVLEFFKSQGPGHQTRMNAVLRTYMEAMQR